MKVLCLTEGLLAAGWKEWWLLKQEKQSCMICLTQALLSQLFAWKCCSMMMPSIVRMDILQLDIWRAVFHSTKEVLVISFRTLDIQRCVQDVFLRASQSNGKPREEPFLSHCWYVFKLRERPSHPGLLQQMKPGSIILNWRQKGSPQNGAIVNPRRRKNSDIFYQWARSSLSSVTVQEGFLWQQCWDGRQSTLMLTPIFLQNSESVSNEFGLTRFQQNSASAWQYKAAYKCEDPGSHYKICLDSITPSTLQPQSCTFRLPPIWSPEGCTMHYKVW